jgi:hypothetical protein
MIGGKWNVTVIAFEWINAVPQACVPSMTSAPIAGAVNSVPDYHIGRTQPKVICETESAFPSRAYTIQETRMKFALIGAAVAAAAFVTPALAQAVIEDPGYCAQFYPNANCQNLGPGNPYTDGGSYYRNNWRNGNASMEHRRHRHHRTHRG